MHVYKQEIWNIGCDYIFVPNIYKHVVCAIWVLHVWLYWFRFPLYSYMDSEDNVSYDSNKLNGSFGRDVLNAGQPKKINFHDSSTEVSGAEGGDMDEYLDEALGDDDYDDHHNVSNPHFGQNENKRQTQFTFYIIQ